MDNAEYQRRYYGRVYGKRRARVADNQDPEKRGRIKVENTELYGTTLSPWCMPSYPFYGGRDCGFFSVPPLGSLVWIECEEGIPEYPIYSGGFFDNVTDGHFSDGTEVEDSLEFQSEPSSVPPHGRAHYDGSDFGNLKGSYGVPASSFEAEYGEVTILQTKTGHRLEFDDTSGGERIEIHHAKGAHIEILPDGSINIATEGNILTRSSSRKEFVINDREETVGSHKETINGDQQSNIGGESTTNVNGAVNLSADTASADIDGLIQVEGGSLKATISNLLDISCGNDLLLTSFGNIDLTSANKGFFSFSNALEVPTLPYVADSLTIQGLNGNVSITSSDLLGVNYGLLARGGVSPQVYLGNLSLPESVLSVSSVPLIKEPAIMGTQMSLLLESIFTALDAFFTLTSTGGVTPGFGGPNPVLGTASTTAQLALATAKQTFMNPASPLITSDCVYLSKV